MINGARNEFYGGVKVRYKDKARHLEYGEGGIIGEWGVWLSCRNCHAELKIKATRCPFCQKQCVDPPPHKFHGNGVFDVRFECRIRCINQDWLQPIEEEAGV